MNASIKIVCSIILLAGAALAHAAAAPLPADSVYRLDVPLTDHQGRPQALPGLRGRVRIASMFYATCPYVCPMIIDTIKGVERKLTPAERDALGVTLFTLDPERDTPEALRGVVATRRLDPVRWTLERTAPADVRKLAAVLGIQYRQLENRDFNHSSALILLDADGRVLARSSRIGEPDPEFVAAVRRALAAPRNP